MDTAVVVAFVAISFAIICSGIRWVLSIAKLLIHLIWRMIKGIGVIAALPIGLIMKILKI